MKNTLSATLPCLCGRQPRIDYQRGALLWQPGCTNPVCPVHTHSFPLFANESGAVAAWNMHIRQEKRRLRRKRHGGALI